MKQGFWHERWKEGKIGFHRSDFHPFLVRHRKRFPEGGRILVPLAGKSLDIHHLLQAGHAVAAVEWVEQAVIDFFEEAKLEPTVGTGPGTTKVYEAPNLTFYVGDFLKMGSELGAVDGVYDRAAVIALEPNLRSQYAAHLARLTPKGRGILMVTIEYEEEQMTPPPFSVPPNQIRKYFEKRFHIEELEVDDRFSHLPSLKQRGLSALKEFGLWLSDTSA